MVFLFDDFDVPLKTLDNHDDGLLRTLSDYAALIIVTEEPISELRPDFGESSPLLGILRPDSIGLLSEIAARELINKPLDAVQIQYVGTEENFLIQTAGRQPFLLTAACELYFEVRLETSGQPDTTLAFQVQFLNRRRWPVGKSC